MAPGGSPIMRPLQVRGHTPRDCITSGEALNLVDPEIGHAADWHDFCWRTDANPPPFAAHSHRQSVSPRCVGTPRRPRLRLPRFAAVVDAPGGAALNARTVRPPRQSDFGNGLGEVGNRRLFRTLASGAERGGRLDMDASANGFPKGTSRTHRAAHPGRRTPRLANLVERTAALRHQCGSELVIPTVAQTPVDAERLAFIEHLARGVQAVAGNALVAMTGGSALRLCHKHHFGILRALRHRRRGSLKWPSPEWNVIAGSGTTTIRHVVPNLANGTRYYFQIHAVAGDRSSGPSNTAITQQDA